MRNRARQRFVTREERAELHAAREEQLRAVAVANVLALLIERDGRERYGRYLRRDLRADR